MIYSLLQYKTCCPSSSLEERILSQAVFGHFSLCMPCLANRWLLSSSHRLTPLPQISHVYWKSPIWTVLRCILRLHWRLKYLPHSGQAALSRADRLIQERLLDICCQPPLCKTTTDINHEVYKSHIKYHELFLLYIA